MDREEVELDLVADFPKQAARLVVDSLVPLDAGEQEDRAWPKRA
jgi:hypothetical protein